jgi:cytochrome c-type biogenesis protein CcmF
MIPELGQFALILALALALCQALIPLAGFFRSDPAMLSVGRGAAFGQFVFVAVAFGCLVASFLANDFSVLYVAQNSQLALPTLYKVSASWAAHEGSLLLWVLVLAVWTVAVAAFSRNLPESFAGLVLAVLGFLSIGFLLFMILTSNPFDRLSPAAMDGADLNPLLQDPGLAIHPPILYVGYVGFSVAFAFAIAAMISGNLDRSWARWTRPWTTVSWLFLTIGIALGSWWAYYELGWGGWWFWDPVENASFMPWLVGTALIHSLAVTEKRGLFKSWTLLLAIAACSLSLLGTFLVRSGIIVSVHAFASDPTRGYFILAFLGIVIFAALVLFAIRAPGLDSDAGFKPLSRETFLLLNNVLLVIAATLVFLGTLAPLIADVIGAGKISVGKPWFEIAFAIPMIPLLFLVGFGMHMAWRMQAAQPLLASIRYPALIALVLALVVPIIFYGTTGFLIFVGCLAAFWVMGSSLIQPFRSLRRAPGAAAITRAALGMSVAHFGVGVFVLGVTVVSAFSIETDQSLSPGDKVDAGAYSFEMRELLDVEGPNYVAREAVVDIRKGADFIAQVRPQKRQYLVQKSWLTEAGISPGWNRDLLISMGDQIGGEAWSVRVQYKPLVRFIWLGALIMAFGGLLAATDRRYRSARQAAQEPLEISPNAAAERA